MFITALVATINKNLLDCHIRVTVLLESFNLNGDVTVGFPSRIAPPLPAGLEVMAAMG